MPTAKQIRTKKIIRLGIGDVTQPIAPAIIEAMHKAVDEMGAWRRLFTDMHRIWDMNFCAERNREERLSGKRMRYYG